MQARSHETRVAFRQEGAALVLQRMYRTAAYWHEARIYIQMQTRRRNMRVISVAKRWQARALLKRLRREKREWEAKREAASVVLQAAARMWAAMAELRRLQEARDVRRTVNVLWKKHVFETVYAGKQQGKRQRRTVAEGGLADRILKKVQPPLIR